MKMIEADMDREVMKKEYYWASRLILDYQGTINNIDFQSLDKAVKEKAMYLFQEQRLINCERCG